TPPVIGWANYAPIFQQSRARMQRVRMDRSNTYIRVNGNTGWACYQWDFSADVEGQPVQSRGQTTVVLMKRNDHWGIVHNHTSLSPGGTLTSPANTTTPQQRSEEHTSELQSRGHLVCRLVLDQEVAPG